MKTITSYLLGFAITATILAIVFRFLLSYGIDNKMTWVIIAAAILYCVGMFVNGWYFGKKDNNYLPINDVGFRFHLTTYLIHNLVSELWFILGFNSPYEKIGVIHKTAIIWGVFLLLHLILYIYFRKKSIDGLDKNRLFE